MSDTVLAGVLGALLSKTGVPTSGGREAELGADGENVEGASTLFGAFFEGAEAGQANQQTTFETGLFLKRPPKAALAQTLPEDGAVSPSIAEFPTLPPIASQASYPPATFETADAAQISDFAGSSIPKENFKELFFIRAEGAPKSKPGNPLVTNVNGLPAPVGARVFEAANASLQKGHYGFSTVKLSRSPAAANIDSQLKDGAPIIKTVKEDAPRQLANTIVEETPKFSPPTFDAQKFDLSALRFNATPGGAVRDLSSFVAPQFREAFLSFASEADGQFEASAPRLESAVTLQRADAPTLTQPQGPVQPVFYSVFRNIAAPVDGFAGLVSAHDADIAFDPALAPTTTSATTTAAPTLVASSSQPPTAALAGVLPQIQAAVSTRHGRETVEVRLDPPDLGRVRIDFNVENGDAVKAVLSAERSETLDFMKRNIVDLENQLKQAGFGSISFEFSDAQRQFGADDTESPEFDAALPDGAAPLDLRQKIYLSPREFARVDLLL